MNSYTVFNSQITKIKGLILKRTLEQFLLNTILFYSPLASVTLITLKTGLLSGDRNALFALNLVISFFIALLLRVRRCGSLMDELIGIDARLRLDSRLSTSYEYSKTLEKSIFKDLLIKETSHLLQTINPRVMFPRLLNRTHLLIPIFILFFFIALSWDFFSNPVKKEYMEDPKVQLISARIKDFLKKESLGIKGKEIQHPKEAHRALEEMVKGIDEQTVSRDTLLEAVQALTRQIQAEQRSTAERIRTTLNPGDKTNSPVLAPLETQTLDPDEVRKIGEVLKELFQDKVPASIADDISALKNNSRVIKLLDQILDELRADGSMKKAPLSKMEEMGVAIEKSSSNMNNEDQEISSKSAVAGDPGSDIIQNYSQLKGQDRSDTSGEGGDSEGGGSEDGDINGSFYPRAGHDRASGGHNAPEEITSSQIPAIREQGISTPGERYSAQIRSLTAIGNSGINETDVIRVYEREIEEILKKEDIPLNYRQYIKNYFLSIGIGREDNANERAD